MIERIRVIDLRSAEKNGNYLESNSTLVARNALRTNLTSELKARD